MRIEEWAEHVNETISDIADAFEVIEAKNQMLLDKLTKLVAVQNKNNEVLVARIEALEKRSCDCG